MAVYVDALMDYGWRLGPSCHMFADTLDELHAMADKVGMKRTWFQQKQYKSGPGLPHYDLVLSRRKAAVNLGAVEMGLRDACDKWADLGWQPHVWMREMRRQRKTV